LNNKEKQVFKLATLTPFFNAFLAARAASANLRVSLAAALCHYPSFSNWEVSTPIQKTKNTLGATFTPKIFSEGRRRKTSLFCGKKSSCEEISLPLAKSRT
jgi:hypothetical protein